MWSKNVKSFIKHLMNHKMYALITVFGFAISLMFVILLSIYIKGELSTDQFHKNKDRIFRLVHSGGGHFASPVGDRIMDTYPGVESYTRLYDYDEILTLPGNKKVKTSFLMADSAFFTMFTFDLIEGDPARVLETRNGIVLTRSYANKVFGRLSVVGEELKLGDRLSFIVTGIMEDLPQNTHFVQCDAIVNFRVLADIWGYPELLTTLDNNSFGLYFLAKPGSDLPSMAPLILKDFRKDYWMFQNGRNDTLMFEALTDCYFSPFYNSGIRTKSKTPIRIYSAIALLILILAIINYINLTISQAGFRGKEAAIRKILGSTRKRLIRQFLSESVSMCIVSFLLAMLLCFIAEPLFNSLLKTELDLKQAINLPFVIVSVGFMLLLGIISGMLPSFAIVRFNPVDVVKGSLRRKSKSQSSKILISFQFCF